MKISINGGEATQLLPKSPTSNYGPRISPDGKELVYVGYVFDKEIPRNRRSAIYIHSLKEDRVGELKKKHDDRADSAYTRVSWAPDGKAFIYRKGNQIVNIWKMDKETGKKTALTSFETKADEVHRYNWSNDVKKILIVRAFRPGPDVVLIKNRDISKKLF